MNTNNQDFSSLMESLAKAKKNFTTTRTRAKQSLDHARRLRDTASEALACAASTEQQIKQAFRRASCTSKGKVIALGKLVDFATTVEDCRKLLEKYYPGSYHSYIRSNAHHKLMKKWDTLTLTEATTARAIADKHSRFMALRKLWGNTSNELREDVKNIILSELERLFSECVTEEELEEFFSRSDEWERPYQHGRYEMIGRLKYKVLRRINTRHTDHD